MTAADRTSLPTRLARLADTAADDAVAPLWRAAQAFRLLSYLYALGFQIAVNNDLDHRALGATLFAVLTVWTGLCTVAYLAGFGRRPAWVIAEVVVVCLLMMATVFIASSGWREANQSIPTTLWAANAVISAAIQLGAVGGGVAAVAVIGSSTVAKGFVNVDLGRNAAVVILLAVGLVIGMGAVTARRAQERLAEAARLTAATAERDRLSRHVHDGVLQVLALISRRGREIGGPTADLAVLAADQERALRSLISEAGPSVETAGDGMGDLSALLRARASDHVTVSAPADPVLLDPLRVSELLAAVDNALDNVVHHAGDGAKAFVLLEDLSDEVVVSVRDDGVGIAPGRLPEAVAAGRMGISQSIVGRIEALGGTAVLDTGPDMGTEWEFTVPTTGGSSK
ncbi:MacS family sensor histidine kinase [Williamsia phyllosphaerae]|uniref:ATP-binding protein n=1 Tax=Williamsia phyllosphaerae TaxID=885042 RepID=A0ABQ1UE38_9NOCA|nr:DUF5931 domain-containing protein [Williamsia phyllosphaerae]GGF14132.1 ATP-binding protein [Williamsia phyllosphaerae]